MTGSHHCDFLKKKKKKGLLALSPYKINDFSLLQEDQSTFVRSSQNVTVLVCIMLSECELSTNTTWFFLADSLSLGEIPVRKREVDRAEISF